MLLLFPGQGDSTVRQLYYSLVCSIPPELVKAVLATKAPSTELVGGGRIEYSGFPSGAALV